MISCLICRLELRVHLAGAERRVDVLQENYGVLGGVGESEGQFKGSTLDSESDKCIIFNHVV